MASQTGKLSRAKEQINGRAKRQREALRQREEALGDAKRLLVMQRLEGMAEGLELAAKIVEKLMRD